MCVPGLPDFLNAALASNASGVGGRRTRSGHGSGIDAGLAGATSEMIDKMDALTTLAQSAANVDVIDIDALEIGKLLGRAGRPDVHRLSIRPQSRA